MAREPLKLSLKIDPVKAIRNGYSYKEANEMADKMCVNRGCVKISQGVFSGQNTQKDFVEICGSISDLIKKEWFRECVQELWLITNNGSDDMIEHYKNKGYVFA